MCADIREHVISTEAVHSFIVRCAVERPLYCPSFDPEDQKII